MNLKLTLTSFCIWLTFMLLALGGLNAQHSFTVSVGDYELLPDRINPEVACFDINFIPTTLSDPDNPNSALIREDGAAMGSFNLRMYYDTTRIRLNADSSNIDELNLATPSPLNFYSITRISEETGEENREGGLYFQRTLGFANIAVEYQSISNPEMPAILSEEFQTLFQICFDEAPGSGVFTNMDTEVALVFQKPSLPDYVTSELVFNDPFRGSYPNEEDSPYNQFRDFYEGTEVCLPCLDGEYEVSFENPTTICDDAGNSVCHDLVFSTNVAFPLGDATFSFVYDAALLDYIPTNSPELDVKFTEDGYSLSVNEANPSSNVGDTGFGMLGNLAISVNPNNSDGVSTGSNFLISNVCFESLNDTVIDDDTECANLIWVNAANSNLSTSATDVNDINGNDRDDDNSTYNNINTCVFDDCFLCTDEDGDGFCANVESTDPRYDPDDTSTCSPNPNIGTNDCDGDNVTINGGDTDDTNPCVPGPELNTAWRAQDSNDCDDDGVTVGEGDTNDFDECYDETGVANECLPRVNFTLSEADLDCNEPNRICYSAFIQTIQTSTTLSEFELGAFNLSFFYDASKIDFIESNGPTDVGPDLQSRYFITNFNDQQRDLSGFNGTAPMIPFESTIGLLRINVDQTNTITMVGNQTVEAVQDICFDIVNDAVVDDPDTCIDLLWVTNATKGDYTANNTTMSVSSATSGKTIDLDNSVYVSDTDTCFPNGCNVVITDSDMDGVPDDEDSSPNDPCQPNDDPRFTPLDSNDCDGDGITVGQGDDDDYEECVGADGVLAACIPEFEIQFTDGSIDCEANQVCYQVELRTETFDFDLGAYNLRIFYDRSLIDYVDSSAVSVLNDGYYIETEMDSFFGDVSSNGTLSFDNTLGFLDIAVDFNDLGNNSIVADTMRSQFTTIVDSLCFSITNADLFLDAGTCNELVWVNSDTRENYTSALTTVNRERLGITADLDNSSYLDAEPEGANCFAGACQETYTLQFSDPEVRCNDNQACYSILLNTNGDNFNLGAYNLRIFYDRSEIDYVDGSARNTLGSDYFIDAEMDSLFGDVASSGSLPFDNTLGFLDIGVDQIFNGGSESIGSTPEVILNNVCFELTDGDLILDPASCIELIWDNEITNENYTSAITTVNLSRDDIGIRLDNDASTYIDANPNGENCLIGACQDCGAITCVESLQISLGESCDLPLTADLLIRNPLSNRNYRIELSDADGNLLGDTLKYEYVGQDLSFKVICEDNQNSCWGNIILESNLIPKLNSPCDPNNVDYDPAECTVWCSDDKSLPDILISPEEAEMLINQNCGASIDETSKIYVEESRSSTDLCDSIEITLKYSAKFTRHGETEVIELLTQVYTIIKLDISEDSEIPFEDMFGFPEDIVLECGSDSEPEDILALEEYDVQHAYPYLIDLHRYVRDTITIVDTVKANIPSRITERDTTILEDIDGDGLDEWVVYTIIEKVFPDSITYKDSIGAERHPFVPIKKSLCNINVTFADLTFPACGNGKKIIRDWQMIDWCNADIFRESNQTIEIIDTEKPVIKKRIASETVSIDPWTCSARYKLPTVEDLEIEDNCASEITLDFFTKEGTIGDGYITDLWIDNSPHKVEMTASDECGNRDTMTFYLHIVDHVPPSAITHGIIDVSLTYAPDGSTGPVAKVFADAFDAGSGDSNCGEVFITIVRQEDYINAIQDCNGDIIGYDPVSCGPYTEEVDKGHIDRKDGCVIEGEEDDLEQLVPRYGGPWVKFCCDDVGNDSLMVMVFVQDEHGNVNRGWSRVNVVNKVEGSLKCDDVNIDCTVDLDTVDPPAVSGGLCDGSSIGVILAKERDNTNNSCDGESKVIREYFLDTNGDSTHNSNEPYCVQTINIRNIGDKSFDPYSIKWPKHYDGSVHLGVNVECDSIADSIGIVTTEKDVRMGESMVCSSSDIDEPPVWCEPACGLVVAQLKTEVLDANDACQKIINRWTVIDWCTYEANGSGIDDENDTDRDQFVAVEDWAQGHCAECPKYGPAIADSVYLRYSKVDRDGYYTYDQIIKVIDQTDPTITADSVVVVDIYNGAESKTDSVDDCQVRVNVVATAEDFCEGSMTTSELYWDISVTDKDGNPINNESGVSTKTTTGLTASMDTRFGKPGDVYYITWRVHDACNNISTQRTRVEFRDPKAPSPLCISGITTRYMDENGMVTLWGNEFDLGSFDNCTPAEDLEFSIVRNGQTPIMPGEEGYGTQNQITFHCDDMANFASLDIWIFDASGNGDYCTVGLLVGGDCLDEGEGENNGSGLMIAGKITTPEGEAISKAEVTINSNQAEYPRSMVTDTDGQYRFEDNPSNSNYSVSVARTDNPKDGISVSDLAIIQRHIVDVRRLTSAYKVIAADANSDERISSLDIVELKKMILGLQDDFVNNDSWRFVDESQQFYDEENPFPFTESLNYLDLTENKMSENYMGVKIGDVNETANANGLKRTEIRSNEKLTMQMDQMEYQKGQIIEVPVYAKNFESIEGYQFTLNHSGLELLGVAEGALEIDADDYASFEEKSTFIWVSDNAQTIESSEVLFTLTFKAGEAGSLTSLNATSEITQIEVSKGEKQPVMGLDIQIDGVDYEVVVTGFALEQNLPNPFKSETSIVFRLDTESDIQFSVFDMTGKIVLERTGTFDKGEHTLNVSNEDLGTNNGVFYYKLEANGHTATRKMILIE